MKSEKIKVYLSIPMTGRMPEDVTAQFAVVASYLNNLGYEAIVPQLAGANKPGIPIPADLYELNPEIYASCRNSIRQCDVLFADLTAGDAVSIGCVLEIGWAREWGKRVVVAASLVSRYRHAFIKESTDEFPSTRFEAFEYFARKDAQVPCDDTDVPSRPEIDPDMLPKEGER